MAEELLEPSDDKRGDSFGILPPLESYADIKEKYLERHFFNSIKVGDIICGETRSSRSSGFPIDVLCVCFGPVRDLTRCRIKGFLPFKSMPQLTSKTLEKGDYVRAVVSEVDHRHDELVLSLQPGSLPKRVAGVTLGIIDKDEFPLYYRKIVRSPPLDSSDTYGDLLETSVGFANPSCVSTLVQVLGIDDANCKSELPSLRRMVIPPEEYALNLRQKQSRQHALQCVEMGIRYAKRGEIAAAVRQFNRALDLDHDNIEALVARGALYANREDFKKAIENFEKALSIDPHHAEARTYLYESLVGQALSYSRERCYESARRALRKAGDIIPEKRPDLEKMAARFVSPSMPTEVASSPVRSDCQAPSTSPKSAKKTQSQSPRDRSSRNQKSKRAISVSSTSSSSSKGSSISVSSGSSHSDKKKRHSNSSKAKAEDTDDSPKIVGVSHDSSKQTSSRSRQNSYKSPEPAKRVEHVVAREFSSAKRPRLDQQRQAAVDPRRLRHSMSAIDSYLSVPVGSSTKKEGESLEEMERFLQDLKQKHTSISSR